jgi:putative membrane protein
MMGYGGFGSMGDFGGLGMVFGLLVLVALIALVVRGMSTRFSPQSRAEDATPLEIVQRRYARGEISEAEYERGRKALG